MRATFLSLVYAGIVLAVSLLAIGPWGVAAAAMVLAFWWLWRGEELLSHALAVLVLLGLVAGLLLGPAVWLAREAAQASSCLGHMFYLGHALRNYHEMEGHLPPLQYDPTETGHTHSWRVALLPYLESGHVHEEYRFDQPWDAPLNRDKIAQPYNEIFFCPVHNRQGSGLYLAITVVSIWPLKVPKRPGATGEFVAWKMLLTTRPQPSSCSSRLAPTARGTNLAISRLTRRSSY